MLAAQRHDLELGADGLAVTGRFDAAAERVAVALYDHGIDAVPGHDLE